MTFQNNSIANAISRVHHSKCEHGKNTGLPFNCYCLNGHSLYVGGYEFEVVLCHFEENTNFAQGMMDIVVYVECNAIGKKLDSKIHIIDTMNIDAGLFDRKLSTPSLEFQHIFDSTPHTYPSKFYHDILWRSNEIPMSEAQTFRLDLSLRIPLGMDCFFIEGKIDRKTLVSFFIILSEAYVFPKRFYFRSQTLIFPTEKRQFGK